MKAEEKKAKEIWEKIEKVGHDMIPIISQGLREFLEENDGLKRLEKLADKERKNERGIYIRKSKINESYRILIKGIGYGGESLREALEKAEKEGQEK